MGIDVDSMNGKIYVYISFAYDPKFELQENGRLLKIECKHDSRTIPLPVPAKKIERIESVNPDMYVVTIDPKYPDFLPKELTEHNINEFPI